MIRAEELKTGMVFHDGSKITVLSETKCFINVKLADGEEMKNRSIERKWKKSSVIQLR